MTAPDQWLAELTRDISLGSQAERVVSVLAHSPQFASYASGREVAERAGANVSTVVRTAQQVGFNGWPDLRLALRNVYHGSSLPGPGVSLSTGNAATLTIHKDASNLASLETPENVAAIRATAASIRAAHRTVVVATGTGAGPARVLGYQARIAGFDVHVADGPATSQVVEVSQLRDGDCVLTINIWRLTRALRTVTRLARERGATVSVLTDLASSPLGKDADHLIVAPVESIDRMPSVTAPMAVVQAILSELVSESDYRTSSAIERAWNDLDLMDDEA